MYRVRTVAKNSTLNSRDGSTPPGLEMGEKQAGDVRHLLVT